MSATTPPLPRALRAALGVLIAVTTVGACGGGHRAATGLPSALQPQPDDAAEALVSAWVARDRSLSLTFATKASVDTLFGHTAPSDLVSRTCSTSSPIVCTYGPPGAPSPADPVYGLHLVESGKGWYVGSVSVEG